MSSVPPHKFKRHRNSWLDRVESVSKFLANLQLILSTTAAGVPGSSKLQKLTKTVKRSSHFPHLLAGQPARGVAGTEIKGTSHLTRMSLSFALMSRLFTVGEQCHDGNECETGR